MEADGESPRPVKILINAHLRARLYPGLCPAGQRLLGRVDHAARPVDLDGGSRQVLFACLDPKRLRLPLADLELVNVDSFQITGGQCRQ